MMMTSQYYSICLYYAYERLFGVQHNDNTRIYHSPAALAVVIAAHTPVVVVWTNE